MSVFFQWWQHEFMRYAFFAILLIMPLFSLMGNLVVNNGLSFFSDALGHSVLTGVGIGVLLHLSSYNIAMIVFSVAFALLMNKIRHSNIASSDTVIGVFSSCSIALGLAILSKNGGVAKFQSFLVGDILSIGLKDILILSAILLVVLLVWAFLFNSMLAVSISSQLSRTRKLNPILVDNILVVLIALVVVVSIQWVGILIINAMLVLPAAAARNVSKNVRMFHLLSLVFALFSGIIGLLLSYYYSISTGPMIVLISALLYFGTFFMRKGTEKSKS